MTKSNTILKSTTAVMLVVLFSKMLGFLRQALVAGVFGSNDVTDIYFISSEFTINVAGAFTTALTTALVTVYIAVSVKDGKKAAGEVASKVLVLFLMVAAVAIVLLDTFAPQVGHLLAPAYEAEQLGSLARYLRIFSVAFLFSAFQSIYAAVLNANNIFVPGKFYGVIYNPLVIASILLLGERLGISAIVYAYYLANILQILYLHLRCRGIYSFRPTLRFRDERMARVWWLALPILFSNVIMQCNGIVDKALCSYLGDGVVSAFTYARSLEQFVTGTFTATVTMVLLSQFAAFAAQQDTEKINAMLKRTVAVLILLLVPVAVITILSSKDIVTLVYMRGKFTWEAVDQTTLALVGFAVGFPLIALREVMVRIHFAFQKTRIPMLISVAAVGTNVILSLSLFRVIGVMGITLSTSLSAVLSVVLLVVTAKRYMPEFRFFSCRTAIWKCAVALIPSAAAVCWAGTCFADSVLLRVMLELFLGCAVYGVMLLCLRCKELTEFVGMAAARVRKNKQ